MTPSKILINRYLQTNLSAGKLPHFGCPPKNFKSIHFEMLRKDSLIDFSTHNVKWTSWGWGVLGVDVIGLKIDIFSCSNH